MIFEVSGSYTYKQSQVIDVIMSQNFMVTYHNVDMVNLK